MSFETPPLDSNSQELADWLELSALVTEARHGVRVSEINSSIEIEEEAEPDAIHDEDDLVESRIQAVASVLQERKDLVKSSYPFVLSDEGSHLALSEEITAGGHAYLLCLILSQAAPGGFLSGELSPDLDPARDLFQVCATLCAAGIARGPAFSFGWPRPDKSGFHAKLLQVYGEFGDGIPHAEAPVGAPPRIKDGGIDVIAWRRESDGLPSIPYVLGQAASGSDWKEKSIVPFVNQFHGFWFYRAPVAPSNPVMFIPFIFADEQHGGEFRPQDEIYRGSFAFLELLLGVIYYRLRIPMHVDLALRLAEEGIGPIERLESLQSVAKWVESVRQSLRELLG